MKQTLLAMLRFNPHFPQLRLQRQRRQPLPLLFLLLVTLAGFTAPINAEDLSYPQQILDKGIKNFIISQENNTVYYIDGKRRQGDQITTNSFIHKGYGILFDRANNTSYRYYIDENTNDKYFPLTELGKAPNNAYWFSFYSNKIGNYFVFLEQGKFIKPEKETFILAGSKQYIKTPNDYYVVENFRQAKPDNFYPAKIVNSSDFFAAKTASDDLFNTNLVSGKQSAPTKAIDLREIAKQPPQVQQPKGNNNNFGCHQNKNCLVKYFNSRIGKLTAQGKTESEAKKVFGEEFDSVFKKNPKFAYEVVMALDQDKMLDAMSAVSKETRGKLRAMAMGEVKSYTDKYGTPEIKTVPYTPKK